MATYRVFLTDILSVHAVTLPTWDGVLAGFWIDSNHKYVESETEGEFWIPSSQITFVQKIAEKE